MRLGTRGSALALAQAAWVAERIDAQVKIVTVATAGDTPGAGGDKTRWVSGLERALLAGEIDIAVHSAKDLPTELPAGLELVAIPQRADPRDAICGFESLHDVPTAGRIGTSSLRRTAQIRALREDLEIVEVRGNVDTRLRKLADRECDALVLAVAGLERLGRDEAIGGVLDGVVPAAGQGALAVEARIDEAAVEVALGGLIDAASAACVTAERALVHALGASCDTPIGAYAELLEGGGLELEAWLGLPDGSAWLSDSLKGSASEPVALGQAVAERMRGAGAERLLDEAARVRS
jgi:hydroxymethylbilane synthase